MTILEYITPSRLGGAERYFLRLVEHLGLQGHRVIVVTKRDTPLRHELEALHARLPVEARPQLHFWHTHGKIDPLTLIKLCALIVRERVKVINTHLTTASWQGTLAGKILRVPCVAMVHATDRKTFFQWADQLIAVSGGVEDYLVDQGVPRAKITRLYCGVAGRDTGRDALSLEAAKVRLNLPPDARTVGVAASLIRRKGHRFLLESMKMLEPRVGKVHALFAGEGDQEELLREQARALGLSDQVHFLGFRRDIGSVIAAMDVFALPSQKEGLSLAVMEAMLLGRPVVATAVAGMPEVVRDGETGLLVPPSDPKALAGALEKLLADPQLGQRLSVQAREFLGERFDERKCLGMVESFLETAAAGGHGLTRGNTNQRERGGARAGKSSSKGLSPRGKVRVVATGQSSTAGALRVMQVISPSKIAGAERSTVALCQGLLKRGNQVWLFVKEGRGEALVAAARRDGVETQPLRIGGKLNVLAPLRLLKRARRHRVQLIATQLSTASLWGSVAARLLRVPCVATVRALNTKTCYLLADRIIVVSHAVKDHLCAQGLPASRMRVVYNGIDLERFVPVTDSAAAKRAVGLPEDKLVVGVAAHLTHKKGHAWFLEAAARVTRETPDALFLLVGEGKERAALEAKVRRLGLQDKVVFTGFQQNVVPWMAAMDTLVLPAIAKEGFGRVLVEAGAMAKPVISTNVGGVAEVVAHEETGFVVKAGDITALANSMQRLLSDADLRQRMGEAGRERAETHFSVERMVEETEKVYRELLAERASVAQKALA